MNSVVLVGRLTKDVEVRYTEKELPVSNFMIAVKKDYKNADGEYESDFINCVSFGNISEYLNKYAIKGNLIAVSGRLQTRVYEDKEGNKRHIAEVFVHKTTILSNNKKESEFDNLNIKTDFSLPINEEDMPF